MIINDLNIICVSAFPLEAYVPLISAPYAVLPLSISLSRFESVPWWDLQCVDIDSGIDHIQFTQGNAFNVTEFSGMAALKQRCGFLI